MVGLKNAEWVMLALVLAMAIALTTPKVQALAVSKPKMEDLNPKGEPWIPARVGEETEFQIMIWGEENTTVEIRVKIENENALGFASFDPESFTLTPGESKQVRCIFKPTMTGIFKSLVVISESSPDNVPGNPILGSIAFEVEVHAELPPPTIEEPSKLPIIQLIVISMICVIVAVISLVLLKLKFKRRVRRVLQPLGHVWVKITSTAPPVGPSQPTLYSPVDGTKDNDNILTLKRSPWGREL